jgi:hypothetical protein
MSTEEVKSYTIEVPATRASIMELVREIFQDGEGIPNHQDTRVKLTFGTCGLLLCTDERERAEHRNKVKVLDVLNCLRDAYYAVEVTREEGQE